MVCPVPLGFINLRESEEESKSKREKGEIILNTTKDLEKEVK